MTIYRLLADAVVVAHAAYVAFVVFGLLAVLIGYLFRAQWIRNFWFRAIHLTMILIVVLEAWFGVVCPLTSLEQYLRRQGGEAGYQGDFIGRWVHDLIFVDLSPTTFTVLYTLFGLTVLATFLLVPPRWPGKKRVTSDSSKTAD